MTLNGAHILSPCSICLVGMSSPGSGMHWFGVSRNIWTARQEWGFDYCSAHFLLQSPGSFHPLIPLSHDVMGRPAFRALRDSFHSCCDSGGGGTHRCHCGATEPREQLLGTHLPWRHAGGHLGLPSEVKKHMAPRHSLQLWLSSSSPKAVSRSGLPLPVEVGLYRTQNQSQASITGAKMFKFTRGIWIPAVEAAPFPCQCGYQTHVAL